MQHYNGTIYFIYDGCLYKNNTVIISSGQVNDACVIKKGICYLYQNSYIALHKTSLYCKVPGAHALSYHPYENWIAAYGSQYVYIIQPNFTIFKKYKFTTPIHHAWMAYDHDNSELYLSIACGHHLYITDGIKKQHFYCTDTITGGNEHAIWHSNGFYIRSYLTKERIYVTYPFFSDTPFNGDIHDAAQVCNIITGCPVQKAFYLDPQYLTIVPDYGCCVIFSSGSNLYLLIIHFDGRAHTLQIATCIDDWIPVVENSQYFLYLRRKDIITRNNLSRELSYVVYSDPDKKIPHYTEQCIKLEWEDCFDVSIMHISLINFLLRFFTTTIKAIVALVFWIITSLPAIVETIVLSLLLYFVLNCIRVIFFH